MKTYYHGSSIPNLKVLEPQFDSRLGIRGVFISDEPFGPMLFSLLPERSKAEVQYETENGKFVCGTVRTPTIHDEGVLYEVSASPDLICSKEGETYIASAVEVAREKHVTLDDVKKAGWEIIYI